MPSYMNIQNIEGDVTAKGHENWIEIKAIQFNTERQLNTQPGRIRDREGNRPYISEFIILKDMDNTSPLIFAESCVGKAKPQIKIHLCTTGDEITPYMEYVLSNVIISAYSIDSSDQNDSNSHYPNEIIRLNFDKVEMKYTPFDENHTPQTPIPAGYDLKQATAI